MDFDLPTPDIIAASVDPDAAIDFWAWKTALPYDEVKKLAEGARARAFYVAGLAERGAVQTVKDALDQALKNGETLESFKGRIGEIINKAGWQSWRVETIFRNNIQTAYGIGRYKKMQAVKEARPYWQYEVVGDERTRPSHAVLAGRVYPADHEFWNENYPPNGHRCRCSVRSLSGRQVEKEGLNVESELPGPAIYTNPKTGKKIFVELPGGDNGFRTNPGKDWLGGLDLKKFPDLHSGSYEEQRLRPNPVGNFAELAEQIKQRCGHFLKNSQGFQEIIEVKRGNYFMATDCKGALFINNKNFKVAKGIANASKELQKAWNKLAKGQKLTWMEEYALESLWHEITHNRQVYVRLGSNNQSRRIMETVTQWTARRTYPELLKSLGVKATHQESIKRDGLGYDLWIRNFDRLVGALKLDEDKLLEGMQKINDSTSWDKYKTAVCSLLHEQSGVKKGVLQKVLGETDKSESYFENLLRTLKLIN